MKRAHLLTVFIIASALVLASIVAPTKAWSNGGYSTDPAHPAYGTHDWIAQHALDWLPTNEKQYIMDNLAAYLYGTELPDNSQAPDGIGDTAKHHVYYKANGDLQDDAAALRASAEYQTALTFLNEQDYVDAAKTAGTMSHYIADVAVFAHVMGANTDWGAETGSNHENYENYVDTRTNNYTDTYSKYLSFNGPLKIISAYNATINLAFDTTFDGGGIYTCVWMNNNYDTSNPNSPYWDRAGESLNLATNAITEVLHTLYVSANIQTPSPAPTETPASTPTSSLTPSPTPSPTTIPAQTPAQTATPPTSSLNPTPSPSLPAIPELGYCAVAILVIGLAIISLTIRKRRLKTSNSLEF